MTRFLIGEKFGRLTVIEKAERLGNKSAWLCLCECGNKKIIRQSDLVTGKIKSCGCLGREQSKKSNTTHNLSKKRIYRLYHDIKQRCLNPKNQDFRNYGGRGIKICDEWLNDFMNFYNWAMDNGYTDKLTIDRINVNGNYEPDNCRWATYKEQARNTRRNKFITYENKKCCIAELAEKLNVKYRTLYEKYKNGKALI